MIQRSSGTPCLRSRVSGLADGSLPDDVRDRGLAHVAGCAECRLLLDVERLLVERLRELPTPAPTDALTARLLALGEPGGPMPPRPGRVAGTPRQPTAGIAAPAARASGAVRPAGSTRPSGRRPGRRGRRVLATAAGVLSVGALAVTAIAALPSPGRLPGSGVPPVSQLQVQQGAGARGTFNNASLLRLSPPSSLARPTTVPASGYTPGR